MGDVCSGASDLKEKASSAGGLPVFPLPHRSGWKVFTGNELAALLGWWMFLNWRETHPDPADSQKVYMLATTVSSKILQAFARIEGFHFEVGR